MSPEEALQYLADNRAVVRFYKDDDDGAEMVRIAIEDKAEEHRTVVKKRIEGDATVAFCEAVQTAKDEFESTIRRRSLRVV